jgi:hypothetical protein
MGEVSAGLRVNFARFSSRASRLGRRERKPAWVKWTLSAACGRVDSGSPVNFRMPLFGSHPDRAHIRDDKPSTWILNAVRRSKCDLALAEANLRYSQLSNAKLAFHKPGKVPLPQIGTLRVCDGLTATPLLASCPYVRVTGFCRSFLNF